MGMYGHTKWAAGLILLCLTAGAVAAEDAAALEQRVRELEAKVSQLQDNSAELQKAQIAQILEEIKADGQAGGNVFKLYWKDGVKAETADGLIKMSIGGRAMLDWTWVNDSGIEQYVGSLQDRTEVRRARLHWDLKYADVLAFKWEFDFAGGTATVTDTYLELLNLGGVGNLRAGHFKEPMGLEQLTSSRNISLIERSSPTEAFTPGRNMGVMFHGAALGEKRKERMTYAVGAFRNTDNNGNIQRDEGYAVTGRVTGLPIYEDGGKQLVHVGAGYSYRDSERVQFRAYPEARPRRFVDTGAFEADHTHLFNVELAGQLGSFHAQSELFAAHIDPAAAADGFCLWGWYFQAGYFLTGEHRPYRTDSGTWDRVKPLKNYGQDGGWGAWEIVGRVSYLDLEHDAVVGAAARSQLNGTVGVNWYLNPNVRLMANYVRACVDGQGWTEGADIFVTRVQFDW